MRKIWSRRVPQTQTLVPANNEIESIILKEKEKKEKEKRDSKYRRKIEFYFKNLPAFFTSLQ